MKFKAIVQGFSCYTAPQMEKMKADLGISMPLPLLRSCAAYYAQAKRDPYVEELRMLDLFSAEASCAPSASFLTQFSSEDRMVAETYADFLQKKKELAPNNSTPPTLYEIAKTATSYLNRIGRRPSADAPLLIQENPAVCASLTDEAPLLSIGEGDLYLRAEKQKKRAPAGNDCFLLLSARSPEINLQTALGKLLSDPCVTEHILASATVGKRGLLYEILCLTDGAWIDLSRLSRVDEPVPFSLAVSGYEGTRILRVPSEKTKEITAAANALSLSSCVFAVVTGDRKIRLSNRVSRDIFLDTAFLVSLRGRMPTSASLPHENPTAPRRITHALRAGKYCPYLHSTAQSFDAVTLNGSVLAAAHTVPDASPFLQGIYTALAPICTLAACGCAPAEQSLSITLSLPKTPAESATYASATAMLLGLYRVMAETAIPARRLTSAEEGTPMLSIVADAAGEACPNQFTAEGNRVYLWNFQIAKNGLPDFEALRKDLAMIADLRRKGHLLSARLLCDEELTDALKEMSRKDLVCRITHPQALGDSAKNPAILIESAVCLPATQIGKTVYAEPTAESDRDLSLAVPSPSRSNVWADRPTISILANAHDKAAVALASVLTEKGAAATVFTETEADVFSRALLTSHALILCGKATLPDTPHVRFALETLRRADGRIFSVCAPDGVADFSFKNGFPEEILNKICVFSE